jgi:hypothetical protein
MRRQEEKKHTRSIEGEGLYRNEKNKEARTTANGLRGGGGVKEEDKQLPSRLILRCYCCNSCYYSAYHSRTVAA